MMNATDFLLSGRRVARLAALLSCGLAVQGCADGFTLFGGQKEAPPEQVVVPLPDPAVTEPRLSAETKASSASMTRKPTPEPARTDLALSVIYYERILVPVGSDLTVRAQPADGGTPSIKTTEVQTAIPYTLSIPVSTAEAAYPMTVTATLTSTIGHVLSGSVTLDQPSAETVEILIKTRAE